MSHTYKVFAYMATLNLPLMINCVSIYLNILVVYFTKVVPEKLSLNNIKSFIKHFTKLIKIFNLPLT